MCIAISILVTWNFRKMSKKPVGREEGERNKQIAIVSTGFRSRLRASSTWLRLRVVHWRHAFIDNVVVLGVKSGPRINQIGEPIALNGLYRGELQLCARFNSYEIQKMASASKASKHWNILQKFRFKCRQLDENERFTVILERLI